MSNENAPHDEHPRPAVGGPVERLLGADSEARRWIVCWDDGMGACWPMGRDEDCEGALCSMHNGKIVMFCSRAAARKAIKVSTAYAKLRKAQGLHANDDFLEGIVNVRVVECESAQRLV